MGRDEKKTIREVRIIVLCDDKFFIKIIRLSTSFGQVDVALNNSQVSRVLVNTRPQRC